MKPGARPAALALVFAGGALGGLTRYAIDEAFALAHAWELLAINVVGSALLGLVAGVKSRRERPLLYAFAGPGFLGGFTTFSGLAAFSWASGDAVAHIALLMGCIVGSVAAAAAGWMLGMRLTHADDAAISEEVVP